MCGVKSCYLILSIHHTKALAVRSGSLPKCPPLFHSSVVRLLPSCICISWCCMRTPLPICCIRWLRQCSSLYGVSLCVDVPTFYP